MLPYSLSYDMLLHNTMKGEKYEINLKVFKKLQITILF